MLCKSCGASFPPKQDRCPYCGAGRPHAPIGNVGNTACVCPTCHSALVKVPEKREYFATVTQPTARALELQAQHEAEYQNVVRAHRLQHLDWGCGVAVSAFGLWLGGMCVPHSFLWKIGVYGLLGGIVYAAYRLIATECTMPPRPPLPEGAEETEGVEVLERTHSGMMLKCLSCGWEDWEFNYNEAAQAAERTAQAARDQADAAERAADAAERQATTEEEQLWDQRMRDD